ncbi:RICIN domain-containing protein [Streptomyces sp. NPDC002870]|uniref:RICIN domain-containing protein n=1 Tax=Streptomyces sp. NPDC002870 TaxID=3364666 RepID=UPI0036C71A03
MLYTDTQGFAYVIAEHSGKCMDVQGGSKANGAKFIQWDCNGRNNQTFRVRTNLTGYVALKPRHAGKKCLDIPGASQQNNVQAIL